MLKRTIVGIAAAAVFLGAAYLGEYAMLVLVWALNLIAVHEMLQITVALGKQPVRFLGYGFALLLVPAYYFLSTTGIIALYALTIIVAFSVPVFNRKRSVADVYATLLFLIYPSPMIALVLLSISPQSALGTTAFIMGVACACLSDTLAYFGGRLFGKRKLCPQISPKKTVEGAISGLLGGALGGLGIWIFQGFWGGAYSLPMLLVLGVVLSVAAQIGDLAASSIKRASGVKDFGNILPGHGGVLDRVDSILFAAPCAYILLFLLTGV